MHLAFGQIIPKDVAEFQAIQTEQLTSYDMGSSWVLVLKESVRTVATPQPLGLSTMNVLMATTHEVYSHAIASVESLKGVPYKPDWILYHT
jgi:hypothetical protein